ncbi:MAG: LptF/LptG family permease [Deinococcota bacterium]|nr:LptF/LptG family permease [Deinococcota bacterium]
MSRLSRYLLLEVSILYVVGVGSFILLLMIDFLTLWARFLIDFQAPLGVIGRLLTFQLPYFLHLSLPVAVVFAILLATGRLARDSELKAVYASGVPPLRLLAPLLLFGAVVSIIAVVNNGFLEPRGQVAYERTVASFFYERPTAEVQPDVSYVLADGSIFFAGRLRGLEDDLDQAQLQGVLVILPDGSQISAPAGVWDSRARTWALDEAVRSAPDAPPERLGGHVLPFDTRRGSELVPPNQRSLDGLWDEIRAVRETRGDARELLFEFHRRVADASGALIFALLAGTLGLGLRGRSGGFAWTIVLLVVFYFLWTLAGDLHDQRVLSPALAAWFTPAVVGGFGALLALTRLR